MCDLSSLQTERNLQVRCPKQTVAGCFDSCVAASVYHDFTKKKQKKQQTSSECLNVSSWSCFPRYHACQIENISLDLCVVIYCRSDSAEEPSSRVKLPPRLSAMTSFRGLHRWTVCCLSFQRTAQLWELIGEVIPHTFPGKDRCVYLDRPHPGLRVLDVDNFSRVGNMQELRQAITLPHQLPWRSNMDTVTVTHLLSSTDAYSIAS